MNMWGLKPGVFGFLREHFTSFLEKHGHGEKTEFFIPTFIDELIQANKASVKVLTCEEQWYGVTYKEDKESVVNAIGDMIRRGLYEKNLWEGK